MEVNNGYKSENMMKIEKECILKVRNLLKLNDAVLKFIGIVETFFTILKS